MRDPQLTQLEVPVLTVKPTEQIVQVDEPEQPLQLGMLDEHNEQVVPLR